MPRVCCLFRATVSAVGASHCHGINCGHCINTPTLAPEMERPRKRRLMRKQLQSARFSEIDPVLWDEKCFCES